jgi:hypothetical protein
MSQGTALTLEPINPNALVRRETAADVLAASAKALVQARYIVAYQHPRDWDEVRQRILKDCERPIFAETAIYSKPMGGSNVQGLSVRFAESAQRAMTNLLPERTCIYDDAEKRIVRVTMTDLEANVTHSKDLILEKRIERKNSKGRTVISQRLNSYGETVYIVEATEDELLVKESALSSKVERQLTLKLLPGDIQEEAIRAIRETQKRADKADPDAAKKRLIDSFDELGVKAGELKSYLELQSLDSMQPADIKRLREIYAAMKEGEATWRQFVEQKESAKGTAAPAEGSDRAKSIVDKIKKGPAPVAAAQATTKAATPWPAEAADLFDKLNVPPMQREAMYDNCGRDDAALVDYLQDQLSR